MQVSQRVVLDILWAEYIFINDEGIMVCHKEWLLTCDHYMYPIISALKLYIFQSLKNEPRQPYHTKVLKWSLLNPGLSSERIGYRIIILPRHFQEITQ